MRLSYAHSLKLLGDYRGEYNKKKAERGENGGKEKEKGTWPGHLKMCG